MVMDYAASFPSCSYHCCFLAQAKVAHINYRLHAIHAHAACSVIPTLFIELWHPKFGPKFLSKTAGKLKVTTTPFVLWSMRLVGHRANSADGKVVPG